ncbi:Arsenate-mycothiol transferase ArsC2 [Planctomycetes bacterium Pan216]|uniref:Arsenate-mycothiol transferase ArsC2 n=1 Tax=Kolteria novifilia TaxID=2527975 RepID=A0A518BC35_9BACT|nr:Arsenate-mycothiol transferase ArsC2 [Planctomycetes bacterium Pan216]
MTQRVLILCTGNSCRSQMAEGLWRERANEQWEALSAGSRPAGYVHPLAVKVMDEVGVDIRNQESKPISALAGKSFDLVVTVCDSAKETCPVMPGAKKWLHWSFTDPADAEGDDDTKLEAFREVRDQINSRIEKFLADGV